MIVRNGGASLARCLRSATPIVDRILIGDTGSSDESCTTARSFGAKVITLPWTDDFAVARNELLSQATCDWILVLDADEMLDLDQAKAVLPDLLQPPGMYAYGLWRRNYLNGKVISRTPHARANGGTLREARKYASYVSSFHIRLFRRHPHIRFEHCVHEEVTGSVDRLHLLRCTAPLILHHFGYVEGAPEQRRRKVEYYRELGLRRLMAAPGDFESHLQLGICELRQIGRLEQAAKRFECAASLRPDDSRAAMYFGICMLRLNRIDKARNSLHRAEGLGESGGVLHDAWGDLHLSEGAYAQAVAAYTQAAAVALDPLVILAKRGLAQVHLGSICAGMASIHAAVARNPTSAPLGQLLQLAKAAAGHKEDQDRQSS